MSDYQPGDRVDITIRGARVEWANSTDMNVWAVDEVDPDTGVNLGEQITICRTAANITVKRIVAWEPPPDQPRNGSHNWRQITGTLRDKPGEWARVAEYRNGGSARQVAHLVRRGSLAGTAPAGAFEATARVVEDGVAVWARYVGGAS